MRSDPALRREWVRTAITHLRQLGQVAAAGGTVHETKQFGPAFEQLLDACGWMAFHDPDSRDAPAGLPDYPMVHPHWHRSAYAELKAERGRIRAEQRRWLSALLGSGTEAYLFRLRGPEDVDAIEQVVARREAPAAEWREARLRAELEPTARGKARKEAA